MALVEVVVEDGVVAHGVPRVGAVAAPGAAPGAARGLEAEGPVVAVVADVVVVGVREGRLAVVVLGVGLALGPRPGLVALVLLRELLELCVERPLPERRARAEVVVELSAVGALGLDPPGGQLVLQGVLGDPEEVRVREDAEAERPARLDERLVEARGPGSEKGDVFSPFSREAPVISRVYRCQLRVPTQSCGRELISRLEFSRREWTRSL